MGSIGMMSLTCSSLSFSGSGSSCRMRTSLLQEGPTCTIVKLSLAVNYIIRA